MLRAWPKPSNAVADGSAKHTRGSTDSEAFGRDRRIGRRLPTVGLQLRESIALSHRYGSKHGASASTATSPWQNLLRLRRKSAFSVACILPHPFGRALCLAPNASIGEYARRIS